jgi:hypothetical protein
MAKAPPPPAKSKEAKLALMALGWRDNQRAHLLVQAVSTGCCPSNQPNKRWTPTRIAPSNAVLRNKIPINREASRDWRAAKKDIYSVVVVDRFGKAKPVREGQNLVVLKWSNTRQRTIVPV